MTRLFDNASFGTMCTTREGGKAIYVAHIRCDDTHKILVQGFECPFKYRSDGTRIGRYGLYSKKYANELDIIKIED